MKDEVTRLFLGPLCSDGLSPASWKEHITWQAHTCGWQDPIATPSLLGAGPLGDSSLSSVVVTLRSYSLGMLTVKTATKIASIWREENKITLVSLPKTTKPQPVRSQRGPWHSLDAHRRTHSFCFTDCSRLLDSICEAAGHSLINLSQPLRPLRIQP